MKHRFIIIGISLFIIIAVVGGIVYVGQQGDRPLKVGPPPSEAAEGNASATPSIISLNEPSNVIVTIQITDSRLIPGSVNLQRLDETGKVVAILGTLTDDGTNSDAVAGDRIFSRRQSFTENSLSSVQVRATWALKGVLKRSMSNIVMLRVWEHFSDPGLGISISFPDNLSESVKGNEINFFETANPLLPPKFGIEVFNPNVSPGGESNEEFLKKVAEEKLGPESIIRIVGFHDGGLEVEADTFFFRHFFIFNPISGLAAEIVEGRDGFFVSDEFRSIISTIIIEH